MEIQLNKIEKLKKNNLRCMVMRKDGRGKTTKEGISRIKKITNKEIQEQIEVVHNMIDEIE